MFYSQILSILIEAYLEVLIVSGLLLNGPEDDPDKNLRNKIFIGILLFFGLIIIPLCLIYLIC